MSVIRQIGDVSIGMNQSADFVAPKDFEKSWLHLKYYEQNLPFGQTVFATGVAKKSET